jgi:hypothetical protein
MRVRSTRALKHQPSRPFQPRPQLVTLADQGRALGCVLGVAFGDGVSQAEVISISLMYFPIE